MDTAILADATDNKRTRGREVSETHATTTPVFPVGRYGHRRSGRRRVLLPAVVLGVVLALSAMLTVKLYQQFGQTDYKAQIIGWEENPAHDRLTIEFSVRVPKGKAASCELRARDYNGNELGRRTVVVRPTGGATTVDVKEAVPTTGPAVVGDVLGCQPTD
jgi:hypothetical protein